MTINFKILMKMNVLGLVRITMQLVAVKTRYDVMKTPVGHMKTAANITSQKLTKLIKFQESYKNNIFNNVFM